MQVAGVKDIRSEARMDAGHVVMTFEPGSNVDLLFIDESIKDDAYSAFVIETSSSDELVGNSHVSHDTSRALESL